MTNTITRDQLSELLHTGECVVEFTKINGEVRTMPCTLNELLIPPAPIKVLTEGEIPKVKKENLEVMSVWCLDKKEWRSFRIANVISAKVKID
jgi:uncharacterized protein (UPF0216 family)